MTPQEFNAEIQRMKVVLPNFAASLKIIPDAGELLPGQEKDAVARFWFTKIGEYPVEAFRHGYETAALQRNVFPNFTDVLHFTKEFISKKALTEGNKIEQIMLPGKVTKDTYKYYDNAVYVEPRATEREVDDKVHEQLQLLTKHGFTVTKVTHSSGVANKDILNEYKNLKVKEGEQCYTALMIFVGPSTADWEALGKAHGKDYSWTKVHAAAREEQAGDPGNRIAESFARMRANLAKTMGVPVDQL